MIVLTINSLGFKMFNLNMNYNDLPDGNKYVIKKGRNEASELQEYQSQAKLIAQYKTQEVSMIIFEWSGDEYEEPYVIMIHTGEIDSQSLHRPDFHSGVYSPDTVIKCVNALRNYMKSRGRGSFSKQIRNYINEPWDSLEEYKNHKTKELHESAREEFEKEKELRELRELAREEFEKEKELRELHELAREEWSNEKRSRRIVEEIEINKHEYNIPKMPEVPDEINEIRRRYKEGDITLVEMQREIENAMSDG